MKKAQSGGYRDVTLDDARDREVLVGLIQDLADAVRDGDQEAIVGLASEIDWGLVADELERSATAPADSVLSPPSGYSSWLDYAVATMDTRSEETASLLADESGEGPTREAMREAARTELATLRSRRRPAM